MNLISDPNARAAYGQAMCDLHDTFGRQICVWSAPQEVILTTNPGFNGFYTSQGNPQVQLIPQSGCFIARIKYLTAQEIAETITIERTDEQRAKIELGGVRIRVSGDAKPYLDNCEQVTFDDQVMRILQRDRPHQLLDTPFYDYILQRVP